MGQLKHLVSHAELAFAQPRHALSPCIRRAVTLPLEEGSVQPESTSAAFSEGGVCSAVLGPPIMPVGTTTATVQPDVFVACQAASVAGERCGRQVLVLRLGVPPCHGGSKGGAESGGTQQPSNGVACGACLLQLPAEVQLVACAFYRAEQLALLTHTEGTVGRLLGA